MSYHNYSHLYQRNKMREPSQLRDGVDFFTPTADQKHMLGRIFDCNDGRRFRYCECGGTGIAKGVMTQAEAVTANWVDQDQSGAGAVAASVGDDHITVHLDTALAAGDMIDGYMLIENGTGEGEMYVIKEHGTGTAPRIYVADTGGIRTATTAANTTDITLIKNVYKDVIIVPAGAGTMRPIGVPLVAVTADYFFWAQTRGPCPVLVDTNGGGAALVAGNMCGEPAAAQDDGTVGVVEADGTLAIYGWVLRAAIDLEYALVDLTLE